MPLAAKLAQTRAGTVGQRPVGIEAVRDLVGRIVQRGIGSARREERGEIAFASREEPTQRASGLEHPPERAQLFRCEYPAHANAFDGLAHVVDLADGKRAILVEQPSGFGRLRLQRAGFLARRCERERQGERAAQGSPAAIREGAENAIPLEIGSRLRRAGVGRE